MKNYERKYYGPLVALWISLSVAGVALSWVTWKQLSDELDQGIARAQFNEALDKVFALIQDAETGQRGYIIAGAEGYLEPYTNAIASLPKKFDELAKAGLGDAELAGKILDLRGLTDVKLEELERTLRIRREIGVKEASEAVAKNDGLHAMQKIRKTVAEIRLRRPDILGSHESPARSKLTRAIGTSVGAGLLGVGAGLFAFFLTRIALGQEKRERSLVEAKLRAEQSSEHKSIFMANMSHEIRTPMNAILGFSDLLDGELKDPRHRQWLRSIRTSGKSLLQLINDVLDMSKIEAGVIELHPEPADPREICDFIRTVFTEQASRKGVKLVCEVAPDLPRALLLDRTRLRQILVNLVGNAVKFTDAGYIRIRVRWDHQNDSTSRVTLAVEVEDTGVGIPEDRMESIFKPFAQADSSRPQERQGTGLGLSIVKRLVEMMGGRISVASIVGKGTTFRIHLPDVGVSARLPKSATEPADEEADFNTLQPAILLVVDDNAMNRDLLGGIFERTHHTVHFGSSGEEAVEKTLALKPDLVLLDVRMPGVGGRGAVSKIRAAPGFDLLPIIAVTASSLADEETSIREQFSGYIRKPFTRRELLKELAQFIRRVEKPRPNEAARPAPENQTADGKTRMAELAVKLRAIEAGDWLVVRDNVAINETQQFARKLRILGEDARCPTLTGYAATLLLHTEAYDVAALETELGRFPEMIAEVERLSI